MKKYLFLGVVAVVLIFGLTGCTMEVPAETAAVNNSYANDQSKVEESQARVQKSVPIPQITTSAERQNISKRAKLFDSENVTTYVYLVNYGKVMAFYTVSGKVSSLRSYLTPEDKLVFADGTTCNRNRDNTYDGADSWEPCYSVSSPDIDGAYGENADGIFFFTTDGAYVEWMGDYMVSDQPLKLTTQPELVRQIK